MDPWLATNSFRFDNDEKWFEVAVKVDELVSVNSAHGLNTKTKVVYDQPWTVKFKKQLKHQLIMTDPVKHCPWIRRSNMYYLTIYYIMKNYFLNRDLDNVHKYTQDVISDCCHINDSHILEISIKKFFKPGDYDYAIVKFGISDLNYNIFR